MCNCEDLLVALLCFFLSVERSKETSAILHGMGGPLQVCWGDECVLNENLDSERLGEQRLQLKSGRAILERKSGDSWEFDATRGFPGEDISARQ